MIACAVPNERGEYPSREVPDFPHCWKLLGFSKVKIVGQSKQVDSPVR